MCERSVLGNLMDAFDRTLMGSVTMAYEAPKITEAGRFADLTLGDKQTGPKFDNLWDWSDPATPGSR